MTAMPTARLLFIGFHGALDGSSPESQNELVAALLGEHGFEVRSGSNKVRQVPRMAHQLALMVSNLRWADAVIIDVFSGRRAMTPFVLTRVGRAARLPVILVLHGGGLPVFVQRHPWVIDSTLCLATAITAPSVFLQRSFEARGFTVLEVPNLVDLPASPPREGERTGGPKVLWMRALDTEYRPVLAIEAFAQLLARWPDALLTMAGPDRGLLDTAKQAADRLGVFDRVNFPGYLGAEEKAAALRDHDVFLNTTAIDNTPVSVIEALAAGLPVVATEVGGVADLLRGGKAGLLVRDNDAGALARAVADVLDDDDLRAQLVSEGWAVARSFSPEEVVSSWRTVLERVGVRASGRRRSGCGPLAASDLDQVTSIHCAAFPESATTQLGRRVVNRYYQWQFIGPHPDPIGIGVWSEGELVGFLFGGTRRGAVSGFARSSLGTLAVGAITHPSALRRLAAPKVLPVVRAMLGRPQPARPIRATVSSASDSPPHNNPVAILSPSFGVLAIAVSPGVRGSGAAVELMEAAEALAAKSGYAGMHLTVDTANARARAFYRKLGWVEASAGEGESLLMVRSLAT